MNPLMSLEDKYAAPPAPQRRVSTPHALAAVNRAMEHLKRGNHAAARAELTKSPDAMGHPAVQQVMPMLAEGGEVGTDDRPTGTSSPGSPGVLGAIHDAVAALKDYVIDRPRRELNASRQENEDSYVNHGDPGYDEGGKVSNMKNMAKFMVDRLGIDPEHANRLAAQYHAPTSAVSPAARGLADAAASPLRAQAAPRKTPAMLAQNLQAGFVDPSELNHLMYTDPTLTALINRYQSGVDNNNLAPEQKQALIAKLASMGDSSPPQQPQPYMNPGSVAGSQ
jgi:hypothetical protein